MSKWRTLLILMPALAMAELVTWGFVLLRERGRLGNKLRAYCWIIGHWRRVMEGRRHTQALRRVGDRDLIARCTYRLEYAQTADGRVVRLAHAVFDPLFHLAHRLAQAVIRW